MKNFVWLFKGRKLPTEVSLNENHSATIENFGFGFQWKLNLFPTPGISSPEIFWWTAFKSRLWSSITCRGRKLSIQFLVEETRSVVLRKIERNHQDYRAVCFFFRPYSPSDFRGKEITTKCFFINFCQAHNCWLGPWWQKCSIEFSQKKSLRVEKVDTQVQFLAFWTMKSSGQRT